MGISAVLSAAGAVPVGVVNPFAGANAPAGWLLCYGQAVSRIQYPALFNTLNTTYGVGDGSTTFNVPDLRGRTIAGVDNMGGTDAGRLDIANSSGAVTGSQYVTLTSGQSGLPAHAHANTATFTGTAASHTHIQNAHNHVYAENHPYAAGGSTDIRVDKVWSTLSGVGGVSSETAVNQNTSITPAGSVTVSNVTNTDANAVSGHDNMPPTMVLNYIIKAQ